MDVDRVPASDPSSSPAGSGSLTAAGALGAADAAVRIGVRRHPVVLAAILSDFVVRAIEIAVAINGGRGGDLDRELIRALAGDLDRDLGRAREYAQVRHLKLDANLTRNSAFAVRPGRARCPIRCSHRYLAVPGGSQHDVATPPADAAAAVGSPCAAASSSTWCNVVGRVVPGGPCIDLRYFGAAVHLAHRLVHAIDGTLARHLDLRLSFSGDDDLESAAELAAGLESELDRAVALREALGVVRERILNVNDAREQVLNIERSIGRTLALALVRSRALDRVCAQGVAGRLGISQAEGLAEALLDGVIDDFTSADLTYASVAGADLTGVRWSLSGTIWPPETDVKALLARSEEVKLGGGVLVVTRRGMVWPPARLADWLELASQPG